MENATTAAVQRQPKSEVQEAKGEITYTPFAAADAIKLTVAIVQRWLCKPTKSGAICSESDAMRFMMLCRARRLNPWEGDAYIVGYDGKWGAEFSLITAHQALLKRCEPQPTFQGMDSGVIVTPGFKCGACQDGFEQTATSIQRCRFCHGSGTIDEVQGDLVPEGQTLVGGWAHIERTDRKIPVHRRLSLKAYKPQYQNKFWDDNAAGQIVKCAEADAQRSAYPTLVGGMITEGESGFSMVVKDAVAALPSAISAPPQPKQVAAPPTRQPSQEMRAATRRGPTLVEQPLSAEEAAEAAAGLAPVQSAPQPTQEAQTTIQDGLAAIVTGAGFTFDQFAAWGRESQGEGSSATGALRWDDIQSFEDVPPKAAAFFVRAQTGMLNSIRGGAQ